MRSHPGPNQVYVILIGGNNMRKTTKPALEVAKLISRFRRIMAEAQKAKVRVVLCGTIPDPRPAVDSKLKLLDEALNDLEMGQGNKFLTLRGSMLDAQGKVRTDLYKPNGDIHHNASGTKIASLRIQRMLEIMLPNLVQAPVQAPPAPVQAPVVAKPQRVRVQAPVINAPPVVSVPLVAAVVNAPVVIQHVAVVSQDQVESPMEVEDEDSILQRLFFKKFGRALPEPEKERERDDVDKINFVIDLTDGADEAMEVAAPVVVVKTKQIEVAEAAEINAKVAADRKQRCEVAKARKAIIAFGKTLRKSNVIPEKEAPEIVSDSNMSKDKSVNTIESVNPVETVKSGEEINAEMEADQRAFDAKFGNIETDELDEEFGSEFRLFPADRDDIIDEDDAMIDDV
jgi:hypothetical protein